VCLEPSQILGEVIVEIVIKERDSRFLSGVGRTRKGGSLRYNLILAVCKKWPKITISTKKV